MHRDPVVIDAAQECLEQMRASMPSLIGAMLLTDDGFEIARTPAKPRTAVDVPETETTSRRLASLASSMQALSDAIVRELRIGDQRLSLIETERGRIVFRRIPEHPIVLAAMMHDDTTLGQGMSGTARLVKNLAAALATDAGVDDARLGDAQQSSSST